MKNNLKSLLLSFFYPPKCVFCGKIISPMKKHGCCADCSNTLPYCKAYRLCSHCGKPLPDASAKLCSSCLTHKHYVTRITSALVYTGAVKRAVIAFKRDSNSWMAEALAAYITNMVMLTFSGIEFDAVVSVPPRIKSIKERRERKYDQGAYLASFVARQLGIPYIRGSMVQTRKIMKQSGLSYADRLENVRNCFAVKKKDAIYAKTILLVDDVCTSGASIEECARALKGDGAYRVYAATLARTP